VNKLCHNILEAVGQTPLVELQRMTGPEDARIIVKIEFLNPGGSIKSRPALAMIEAAEREGRLRPDSIIVEPTSGNQGIGLAMVGAVKGSALKAAYPDIKVVVAEPEHAAVLSGGLIGTHIQQGIGDGIIAPFLDLELIDEVIIITDDQALETAKRLAKEEGLLAGISSGTNVFAALQMAKKLGKGKTVLTVLPDTAERYFSTLLFKQSE